MFAKTKMHVLRKSIIWKLCISSNFNLKKILPETDNFSCKCLPLPAFKAVA